MNRQIALLVCALCVLLSPVQSASQVQDLKVGLVASTRSTGEGPRPDLFKRMIADIRRHQPDFPFDSASLDFFYVSYDTPCVRFQTRAVATLTPLKYLECQQELGGTLEPLFVVKKRGGQDSFYTPYFITGLQSGITSLDSPNIKRIYLVNRNSASGYIAPLNKLFERGIIAAPTEDALREKGWKVVFGGEQREVLSRLGRGEPAIAAVGQFPNEDYPERSNIRLLLRYDRLPQDPLFISSDLVDYQDAIVAWFEHLLDFRWNSTEVAAAPWQEQAHVV
jgi:hypothetical protein